MGIQGHLERGALLFRGEKKMSRKFELIATSGMGLNHKAIVTEYDESNADLTSYTTEVMHLVNGELFREANQPQSNTTARHMREFALFYGFPRMTKAQLMELPIF